MSEPLIWRESWLLGIDLLDDEHREMVRLINRLLDETDGSPVTERLDHLIAHLRRHFDTEEVFLRAIDYPETDAHCREHAMQLAEFVDLRRSVSRGGASVLGPEDRDSIRHWFFNHVVAQDQRFGQFYRGEVCGNQSES